MKDPSFLSETGNNNGLENSIIPEKRRSDLTLHLSNGPQISGKLRTRPVLPTSGTSPSLSMIASLISLENYRSTKEPQQQPIYSGANVPAQVIPILTLFFYDCHSFMTFSSACRPAFL